MQWASAPEPANQETSAKERAHSSVKLWRQRLGKVEAGSPLLLFAFDCITPAEASPPAPLQHRRYITALCGR